MGEELVPFFFLFPFSFFLARGRVRDGIDSPFWPEMN